MKRFCCLAALMLLSSSAYAGSFSFVLGGHRVRVEAARHCFSRSCVRVSIPGIYEGRHRRDWIDANDAAPTPAPTPPPAPAAAQVVSRVAVPPASKPAVEPVASVAPPPSTTVGLAAAATQQTAAPSPPTSQPRQSFRPPQLEATQIESPRVEPARVETPAEPAPPAADAAASRPSTVAQKADDDAFDTPLGDWQTEGKGSVRIERCGSALCGYVIDPSTRAKGEAVIVNMKLKTGSQWTGNVYGQNSGDSYYGTLALKGPYTLRVEACALGKFYCSGNNWGRIDARPDRLISSRQNAPAPRS